MAKRKESEVEEPSSPKGSANELVNIGSDIASSDEGDESEEDRKLEELLGSEASDESDDQDEREEMLGENDEEEEEVDPSILDELSGPFFRSLSEDENEDDGITYTIGADGEPRKLLPEIKPIYESDDSDKEDVNTIGDIPLSVYEQMPHIGYDINGKRIMRPATGSALDNLLENMELPEGWTGLLDKTSGKSLNLTKEELDLIKKVQRGENTDDTINPYEDTIEWFTGEVEKMPLSAAPEPKRRFVPSKHEAKRVMKIVKAIREGRIVPNKAKKSEEDEYVPAFDIWQDTQEKLTDHAVNLRAPKLPPPTHAESYNPPEEYLLDDKEKAELENLSPDERAKKFVPVKHGSLRKVPAYNESIRERFERSLDLYLAPRVRKQRTRIDPDSLIPELPSPQDLRPFPIKCATVYSGHIGRVRSVSVDPTGQFLATGGDDGTVRIWEVLTGRELWKLNVIKSDSYDDDQDEDEDSEDKFGAVNSEDHVEAVAWNPQPGTGLLAIAAGDNIFMAVPPLFDVDIENKGHELIEAGWGYAADGAHAVGSTNIGDENDDENTEITKKKAMPTKWTKAGSRLANVGLVIRGKWTIKNISWHRRGDYLVSVSPDGANQAVLIHQLSKHTSQSPFRKSKGLVQYAMFHPFRPHLYVATQRYIRIYDLSSQVMSKRLMPGARWLSSFDIHPLGDNVLTASYDKRVTWHDLDLSDKPYKTLRYHERAVRSVGFHKQLPLFCTASDDGHINVFHGAVYDDMMKNPLLVPLKILKGHQVKESLGVLSTVWHPREAWLFSAGADGTARLWTA